MSAVWSWFSFLPKASLSTRMLPSMVMLNYQQRDIPFGASLLERASQRIEHLTFNQRVDGSIPSALTIPRH